MQSGMLESAALPNQISHNQDSDFYFFFWPDSSSGLWKPHTVATQPDDVQHFS